MSDYPIYPQLIVFEGSDAAGKSTVCAKYVDALVNAGVQARLLSFPGREKGTLGDLVYLLHHDSLSMGVRQMTPASIQALHIAAHLDAIERTIVPGLEAGETIILDRYWWSTWVYGIVGGVDSEILKALIEAERIAWGKWKPGLIFHVTRKIPLRNEPLKIWDKLNHEYGALERQEREHYPTCVLPNEGEIEGTVSEALKKSHGL